MEGKIAAGQRQDLAVEDVEAVLEVAGASLETPGCGCPSRQRLSVPQLQTMDDLPAQSRNVL